MLEGDVEVVAMIEEGIHALWSAKVERGLQSVAIG